MYLEIVLEIASVCGSPFSLYWLDFLDYLLKLSTLLNMFRVQGACSKLICYHFDLRLELHSKKRLTLIVADPRISAALLILSVSKMVLIYLNYRLWSIKLKVIYAKVLDTYVFERNGNELSNNVNGLHCKPFLVSSSLTVHFSLDSDLDVFDMYRLLLFLWMIWIYSVIIKPEVLSWTQYIIQS